jgi:hypothetical protein
MVSDRGEHHRVGDRVPLAAAPLGDSSTDPWGITEQRIRLGSRIGDSAVRRRAAGRYPRKTKAQSIANAQV